jgi:hypothetical protein
MAMTRRIGFFCTLCMCVAASGLSDAQSADAARKQQVAPQQDATITKRVATLRSVSDVLRKTAAAPLPGNLSATDRAEAQRYVNWLQSSASQIDGLAAKGESALHGAPRTQESFNAQYLQLQTKMQSENRSYTAVANIMKTKHDTVKNSIDNIR